MFIFFLSQKVFSVGFYLKKYGERLYLWRELYLWRPLYLVKSAYFQIRVVYTPLSFSLTESKVSKYKVCITIRVQGQSHDISVLGQSHDINVQGQSHDISIQGQSHDINVHGQSNDIM